MLAMSFSAEPEFTESDLDRVRDDLRRDEGQVPCTSLLCGRWLRPEQVVLVDDVPLCRGCAAGRHGEARA